MILTYTAMLIKLCNPQLVSVCTTCTLCLLNAEYFYKTGGSLYVHTLGGEPLEVSGKLMYLGSFVSGGVTGMIDLRILEARLACFSLWLVCASLVVKRRIYNFTMSSFMFLKHFLFVLRMSDHICLWMITDIRCNTVIIMRRFDYALLGTNNYLIGAITFKHRLQPIDYLLWM